MDAEVAVCTTTVQVDVIRPLQKFFRFVFSPDIATIRVPSFENTLPAESSDRYALLTWLLIAS
jgi:hypothetical protein